MNIKYIRHPPLKRVILELNFTEDFQLKISDPSLIYEKIKKYFDIEPTLGLIPPKGRKFEVHLSTLRYSSTDDKRILELGSNFIVFTFNEDYTGWDTLRDIINSILNGIDEIIKFSSINNISLTYIDEFLLSKENFRINDYFNIIISNKINVLFDDFHLGIVPIEEENKKVVIRLKARKGTESQYFFILESVFIARNIGFRVGSSEFLSLLNHAHQNIEYVFIVLLLDKKIQEQIGMIVEE